MNSVGTDSQAGLIVDKLSQIKEMGGTNERIVDRTDRKELAKKNPKEAAMSSKNHKYL